MTTPKNITTVTDYHLVFDDDIQLNQISMTTIIIDKHTGINGVKIYFELKSGLTSKYGKPKSEFEKIRNNDDFYKCENNEIMCDIWHSVFFDEKTKTDIYLKLKGSNRSGSGYINLTYTNKHLPLRINNTKIITKDDIDNL